MLGLEQVNSVDGVEMKQSETNLRSEIDLCGLNCVVHVSGSRSESVDIAYGKPV